MSNISDHVGKRIRLYRKSRGVSIDKFSAQIGKSKSTVSKYENGEISLDIDTLFNISRSLGISMTQLIDYREGEPRSVISDKKGFFNDVRYLYMYYIIGLPIRTLRCVLELDLREDSHNVILYNDVRSTDDFYNCRQLYFGDIYYSDSYVNMFMANQVNSSEKILLTVPNPMSSTEETFGLISGISERYRMPISTRVLIARRDIYTDEELSAKLTLDKNDMKDIRKYNVFMLPSTWK